MPHPVANYRPYCTTGFLTIQGMVCRCLPHMLSDDLEPACSSGLGSSLSTPPPSPTPSFSPLTDAQIRSGNPTSCSPYFMTLADRSAKAQTGGGPPVFLLHATSLLVEPSPRALEVAQLRSTQSMSSGQITGHVLRGYVEAHKGTLMEAPSLDSPQVRECLCPWGHPVRLTKGPCGRMEAYMHRL
jgi:hypothetical protein